MLMITHMAQMIAQFNTDNIEILQNLGFEVHIAANFESKNNTMTISELAIFREYLASINVVVHQVDFERGVGTLKANIRVWHQLATLCSSNEFKLIHCQSPIGGVFGRLLGRKFKIKTIYTAHGFQFIKNGPKKDWVLYYPIERYLSKFTDVLITINSKDFKISKRFNARRNVYIPGVGVNVSKLNNIKTNKKKIDCIREKNNIPKDAFVIVSVGELSKNKNEESTIKALQLISKEEIYYIVVGIGREAKNLKNMAKECKKNIHIIFVGYKKDPTDYYAISNISVFPSKREGLGLAGIEAMASGLPLITTNAGGISDYSVDGETGIVIDTNDLYGFRDAILFYYNHKKCIEKTGLYNRKHVRKYDIDNVNSIMKKVYGTI